MEKRTSAYLVLKDGSVYEGLAFGKGDYAEGEVVFNTGITGYQEILTDPSYAGQIVTMTYPLIGNYGCIEADNESKKIQVRGFIVREHCDFPNNYRSASSLDTYFKDNNILAIEGLDTRALTKKLRTAGTMLGFITTKKPEAGDIIPMAQKVEDISTLDLVSMVTTEEEYVLPGSGLHIGILDAGMKNNIARLFNRKGHKVTVMPANVTAEHVLDKKFDLLMISNGPGDPKRATVQVELIKSLIGKLPLCGICLGHQLISLALGLDTFKLKFGHRGGNHPVHVLETNEVHITTQNHGYAVKNENIPAGVEITHINLNDNTVEGLRVRDKKIFCVQFHPEAAPGPEDCFVKFDDFIALTES